MKHERWTGAFWAWLLAFCAAFGGVGCLQSGLRLDTDMALLAAVFAAAALVMAVCCVFRLYLLPLGSLLTACAIFWSDVLVSAKYLVEQAATLYDRAYSWGIPLWPEELPDSASEAAILAVLGCGVICVVVTALLSGRGLHAAALMALLPLIPCIVVTDTVPHGAYLFALLLSVVLLLMSSGVRAVSLRKCSALLLRLTVPAALALWLLFALIPQAGYTGQADAQRLEDFVVSLLEGQNWIEAPLSQLPSQGDQSPRVDQRNAGHNPRLGIRVMSIKADSTGTMYLRGSAYDTYTGIGWTVSGTDIREDGFFPGLGQTRYVTIQTARVHSVLYFPYAPAQLTGRLRDGQLPNDQQLREYTMAYQTPAGYDPGALAAGYTLPSEYRQVFLQLPQATQSWAEEYLPPHIREMAAQGRIWDAAAEIGQLVKSSASYDRMTAAMPRGETDFVRWFLDKSDTGYCVHFATAATVLLRAAGIPARYVTGYLAHPQADIFSAVTTDESHAWVEYFVPGAGWLVLEVTPADASSPVLPSDTLPQETEPIDTVPAQTEAPIPTTVPSSPTEQDTTPEPSSAAPTQGPATDTGTSRPQAATPTEPDIPADAPTLSRWIVPVLVLLLTAGLVLGQWQLRLWLRQMGRHKGSSNARLLRRWREASLLARLQKQDPSQELRELALKARFSQYTITARELRLFDSGLETMRSYLLAKPWYCQLFYRLVLALY